MKKTFTLLMFFVIGVLQLGAQINADSPIPIDFVVNSPAAIAGEYDYSTQSGWGPQLAQTVTGDVVWAYDECGDSLAMDLIVTDLSGKMALIRRGVGCTNSGDENAFFSRKVWNAQQAGAIGVIICNHYANASEGPDYLIGMAAADTAPWDSLALEVTVPAIFASRSTCEKIDAQLKGGNTVNASFAARAFANPLNAYSYQTPKSGIVPLADMGVSFLNLLADTLPEVTINLEVTDPNGQKTNRSDQVFDIPGFAVYNHVFSEPYLPQAVGEYTVKYTNSVTDDEFERKFVITDYTYAQDNDVIDTTSTGGVFNGTLEPDSASFVGVANLTYDFGNFYRTGSQELTATHVTFILGSYNELWTGDPEADVFKIRIYDADPDGNGFVPDSLTYDELNENTGVNPPVGGADYLLDGATPNFTVTTVELDEPVTLEPNKIYLVMVQYNGVSAGIGIPPKPALGIGTNYNVAGGLSSARYADRFYRDGWGANNSKFVVRLHLDGYLTGTEEPLDKSKISLSPNPATDVVRLQLDLEKPASEVTVRIMDFNGRLLRTEQFENVQKGTYAINVRDLANGAYFMTVVTPEGFRSKKFQVMR